jgi:fumarylacetoacetate (FAA) hydrolase
MKLASLRSGRDGRLIVVSRDASRYLDAASIAPTLQAALDDWANCVARLEHLAQRLASGEGDSFDPSRCHSPLPRAYQWADGSAYVNHVELVRKARGATLPESFWTDPLMYQGGSDAFLAPQEPIRMDSEDWGIDFEAEVAVIIGDVPQGADRDLCAAAIRLVLLVNDVSLRNLIPAELNKGFGFVQSKPSSAFSPLAVTPDELGDSWREGKLHGELLVWRNGELFGRADPGVDMTFDFPTLIAHLAKTRPLCAGSIIGSGTVSNRDADGGPGASVAAGGRGYSCLAELRTVETLQHGAPHSDFLHFGDVVRIEMLDAQAHSIFGAIEQRVEPLERRPVTASAAQRSG